MLKNILPVALLAVSVGCACSGNKCSGNAKEPAAQDDARGNLVQYSTTTTKENGLGRTDSEITEITVVVKAVDTKNRKITIVGPEGKVATLDVGPAVQRLNEIKPGDKVTLQYYEALAFELRKPTAEELRHPTAIGAIAARNPLDLPPALGGARTLSSIVTVSSINKTAGTVTVKTPSGKLLEVKARDPKNLNLLKRGDTIAVTYTEMLAVGVTPAK